MTMHAPGSLCRARFAASASAAATAALLFAAPATAATCGKGPNGITLVTADCVDPDFNETNFVVDKVADVAGVSPYTKVSAHFEATANTPRYDFDIYLPPKAKWQGRFFQHAYPLPTPESAADIAFATQSGGYLVHLSGIPTGDGGYRPDAAAAKMAKAYAAKFYGTSQRIHGYIWGGSGGSIQVLGAMENTTGVWDGGISYVIVLDGSGLHPNSLRALAALALRDKLPAIADAVKPGGGDPTAGMDATQRAIFDETLKMGNPLRTFEAPMTSPFLMLLSRELWDKDPTYAEDFWTRPGYEGVNPPPYLKAAIVDDYATITKVERNAQGRPTSVVLDHAPALGTTGDAGLENWVYAADGKTLIGTLRAKRQDAVLTIAGNETRGALEAVRAGDMVIGGEQKPEVLDALQEGAKVRINNRWYLALHYYHRHALPALDRNMVVYNQYRAADGTPLFPQRQYNASTDSAKRTAGGALTTGKFNGKLMVISSMLDDGAHAWQTPWYAGMVRKAMGAKRADDNFRMYLNDSAEHGGRATGGKEGRLVSYGPMLYQQLRDLAAWAEKGVPAPRSTGYRQVDGQVTLPDSPAARGGIQPVVHLTVDGSDRIEAAAGQPVTFKAKLEVPPGTGKIIGYDWYFGGTPVAFEPPVMLAAGARPSIDVETSHSFDQPGTYFVTLRAHAQRDGDAADKATTIQNLDRVRVVVR